MIAVRDMPEAAEREFVYWWGSFTVVTVCYSCLWWKGYWFDWVWFTWVHIRF